jgi:hypothetical protein
MTLRKDQYRMAQLGAFLSKAELEYVQKALESASTLPSLTDNQLEGLNVSLTLMDVALKRLRIKDRDLPW